MDPENSKESTCPYRWTLPVSRHINQLRIYNSFSRKKEIFIPLSRKSIRWYCCGPTVYDVAHLGHARCYITFDIIRRILSDYFGYHVFYVLNITDIDDKIIKRARSNYLCDRFIDDLLGYFKCADSSMIQKSKDEICCAIESYRILLESEQDQAKLEMMRNTLNQSVEAFEKFKSLDGETHESDGLRSTLEKMRDIIANDRDAKFGPTVKDHQIFKNLTMSFEREYHDDMQRLDVLPPNALSRVSEYIEEIGDYIKKIEANGYAYRSDGSIYFDTEKFDANPKHSYAKLVREAYGHKKHLDEGEGELSTCAQDIKKSPSDFVLWKKSKPGEPEWKAQDFEPGRPGWHIECSVMASKLLGEVFDIHSGGYDLKFPHHDNEIAQAEAYYDTGRNWVNYFIHSGHLTISGCKMSKSLKNFVTIRRALKDYTSRQLRFAFLAHGWTETLDYSPNTMNSALSYERTFREFFLNILDKFRRFKSESNPEVAGTYSKWTDSDLALNHEFLGYIDNVDEALCDNFDTRTALNVLASLVRECNKRESINLNLAKEITAYIRRILSVFGVDFDEMDLDRYLLPTKDATGEKVNQNDDLVLKYVEALARFRADVRQLSKTKDSQDAVKQLLTLCDQLRDETLPSLGVRLEDRELEGNPFVVKLVDPETLAKERAAAQRKEEEKRIKAETQRLEKLKLQEERERRAKLPPSEMFTTQTDKYSKFDEKGLPTHDSSGKELSKSALKKLQRLYEEQAARYNKYLGDQA